MVEHVILPFWGSIFVMTDYEKLALQTQESLKENPTTVEFFLKQLKWVRRYFCNPKIALLELQ